MTINPIEVDARLGMLTEQRNSALNHAVLLAGQIAVLQEDLRKAREAIQAQERQEPNITAFRKPNADL